MGKVIDLPNEDFVKNRIRSSKKRVLTRLDEILIDSLRKNSDVCFNVDVITKEYLPELIRQYVMLSVLSSKVSLGYTGVPIGIITLRNETKLKVRQPYEAKAVYGDNTFIVPLETLIQIYQKIFSITGFEEEKGYAVTVFKFGDYFNQFYATKNKMIIRNPEFYYTHLAETQNLKKDVERISREISKLKGEEGLLSYLRFNG